MRRAVLLLGVVLVGYLYYHPLASYLTGSTTSRCGRSEVTVLRENAKLERQLTG